MGLGLTLVPYFLDTRNWCTNPSGDLYISASAFAESNLNRMTVCSNPPRSSADVTSIDFGLPSRPSETAAGQVPRLLETLVGCDGESIGTTGLIRSACARCRSSRKA